VVLAVLRWRLAAVAASATAATRLVFGATTIRFPLETVVVDCYADAK